MDASVNPSRIRASVQSIDRTAGATAGARRDCTNHQCESKSLSTSGTAAAGVAAALVRKVMLAWMTKIREKAWSYR